jgi:hypothetical protein
MFACYNLDMQRNPQAQKFADRREAPRVDVDGRYCMRLDPCDGRTPFNCSLLDFSVTGARLELPEDVALPENVQILIGSLSHNCRIAWRKGAVVGVDFIDEHHSIF